MVLNREEPSHWAFMCMVDGCIRVWTKPNLREAARLQVAIKRRDEKLRILRTWQARPRYFDMGRRTGR